MKKWLLAWIVFTAYVIANMTMMETAEQPHLVATLLLGFFFFLIFGIRGVYGALTIVATIVVLAVIVHPFKYPGASLHNYSEMLLRLLLDLITISGGGGIAYWLTRLLSHRTVK